MKNINIKKLPKEYNLTLCKVNKTPIGEIPTEFIDEIVKSISDIDTISLTIPFYSVDSYTKERVKNPIYDLIKNERLICLNDTEYYVIKEDSSDINKGDKVIKAYSREYKLGKQDIKIEDVGLQLLGEEKDSKIYSLNKHMKEETGWSFGYIDDSVLYEDLDKKIEKMRWQESVDMRWYDFLTQNIAESFGCIVVFDTKDKLVNLYDVDTVGEEIQIYLSLDNYIKDLEEVSNSSDVVTRMYIVGKEEMDIIGATVTGYPYLENYSYFIENEEMSPDLINALITYQARLIELNLDWKKLTELKTKKTTLLISKQNDLYMIYEDIKGLKSILKIHEAREEDENKARVIAEITKKNDIKVVLEHEIEILEQEVKKLTESIEEINKLCKREYATDLNGALIFDEVLLDELKEFVYCETYSNDSFTKVEDLITAGQRVLDIKSVPTTEYNISVVDFLNRVKDCMGRQHWEGELSLGNIVILQNKEEEILQYLTGYTIKPNNEDGLTLTLSNKKMSNNNIRIIADRLQKASRSMEMINSKKYLWNKQKYNKID